MRGRKPKPTVIQALHGNPRKHGKIELAERLAIEPTDDTLEVPDYFSPSQLEIWHSAVAHAPPGILRRIDGWALRAWVAACDLHRQAMIAQAKTSLLVQMPAGRRRRDKDGKELPEVATALPQQSPLLGIINRQAIIMLRAAEQMGFTPTSRPRIYGSSPMPTTPTPRGLSTNSGSLSLDAYLASAPPRPNVH